MLPDDVRECPACGNPIRHSDYDCSCGWRDRDGWTPADYVRENVGFLTEHIDRRHVPAYRAALQLLLEQVPTLLDIVEAMADQDNPYTVAVLSDEGIWRCEWCGGWREGSRKQHTPDCAYRRARELCGKDGAE